MTDHLHAFNVEVKVARTTHCKAVNAAKDRYTQAMAVVISTYTQDLANAAHVLKDAIARAELTYEAATASDTGPRDA